MRNVYTSLIPGLTPTLGDTDNRWRQGWFTALDTVTLKASGLITSTVAADLEWLSINSKWLVTNLNADLLDGVHADVFALKTTTLTGTMSVSGGGDLSANRTFALVNDVVSPTAGQYYGTAPGLLVRGWHNLPAGNPGTVTSVDLNVEGVKNHPVFPVSSAAITSSGTLNINLGSQTANTFWAAPSGTNGKPTFRTITLADISPVLPAPPTPPIDPSTGTPDYVARWITTKQLGIGLIRDNNTSVGVNTAPPTWSMMEVRKVWPATTTADQQAVNVYAEYTTAHTDGYKSGLRVETVMNHPSGATQDIVGVHATLTSSGAGTADKIFGFRSSFTGASNDKVTWRYGFYAAPTQGTSGATTNNVGFFCENLDVALGGGGRTAAFESDMGLLQDRKYGLYLSGLAQSFIRGPVGIGLGKNLLPDNTLDLDVTRRISGGGLRDTTLLSKEFVGTDSLGNLVEAILPDPPVFPTITYGITQPDEGGLTVSGSPSMQLPGWNWVMHLVGDLKALEGLGVSGATTGYAKRTGADAWSLVSPIPLADIETIVFPTPPSHTITIDEALFPEMVVNPTSVTNGGTFTFDKAVQNANYVWAGPASGGPAKPTFRLLGSADLPAHDHTRILLAASESDANTAGTIGLVRGIWNGPAGTNYPTTDAGVGLRTDRAAAGASWPGSFEFWVPATTSEDLWFRKATGTAGWAAWRKIWHEGSHPTTLAGYGITDSLQPLDADLTAIAALSTTGYAKRTAPNTWALVSPIPLTDIATLPSHTITINDTAVPELQFSPDFVTDTGTFTFTKTSQLANTFWAAPNGSDGVPGFRKIALEDISPILPAPPTPPINSSSGTDNYVARWVDDGPGTVSKTLGIGLIQDDNASVGINVAPFSTAMLAMFKTWSAATGAEQYGALISTTYGVADSSLKQTLRLNQIATHTSGSLGSHHGVVVYAQALGSGGTTTNQYSFYTNAIISGTAIVTTRYGYVASTVIGATDTNLLNYNAFYAADQGAGTLATSFRSAMALDATNRKFAVYAEGTAPNWFRGNVGIGSGRNVVTTGFVLDVNGKAVFSDQVHSTLVGNSTGPGNAGTLPPFVVASKDLCLNLNAELHNGYKEITYTPVLRAGHTLIGGGILTGLVVSTNVFVKWSARIMTICNGYGPHFAASGYYSITTPAVGTIITCYGGTGGTVTVTADGIPLAPASYDQLYYVLTINGGAADDSRFRIVRHLSTAIVPPEWVRIAAVSADTGNLVTWFNQVRMVATTTPGTTYNTTLGSILTVSGAMSITPTTATYAGSIVLSLVNDMLTPGNSKYYGTNDIGAKGWYPLPAAGGGGASGTVTQVGLDMPNDEFFDTADGTWPPVTVAGNLKATWKPQGPHKVFIGPVSGTTDVVPTFRLLELSDLPPLNPNIGTGNVGALTRWKTVGTVLEDSALSDDGTKVTSSRPFETTGSNSITSGGTITAGSTITGTQLISTINGTLTTGLPPLVVTSFKWVQNLNADYLDDKHASAFSLVGHTHPWSDIDPPTIPPIPTFTGTINYLARWNSPTDLTIGTTQDNATAVLMGGVGAIGTANNYRLRVDMRASSGAYAAGLYGIYQTFTDDDTAAVATTRYGAFFSYTKSGAAVHTGQSFGVSSLSTYTVGADGTNTGYYQQTSMAAGTSLTNSRGLYIDRNYTAYVSGTKGAVTNRYAIEINDFNSINALTVGSNNAILIRDQTNCTQVFGFNCLITAATNKWGLYVQGTVQNYLAGNLGIAKAVPAEKLDVVGRALFSDFYGKQHLTPFSVTNALNGKWLRIFNTAAAAVTGETTYQWHARLRISVTPNGGQSNKANLSEFIVTGGRNMPNSTITVVAAMIYGTAIFTQARVVRNNVTGFNYVDLWVPANTITGATTDAASFQLVEGYGQLETTPAEPPALDANYVEVITTDITKLGVASQLSPTWLVAGGAAGVGEVRVTGTAPMLSLLETDAAANNQWFRLIHQGGSLFGQFLTDVGTVGTWMQVDHSGNVATKTTFSGTIAVTGAGQNSFTGQVTIPVLPVADTDAASKKYVDDRFGVGGGVIGSGKDDYVARWDGTGTVNTLTDGVIRDDGTTAAIGAAAPAGNITLYLSRTTAAASGNDYSLYSIYTVGAGGTGERRNIFTGTGLTSTANVAAVSGWFDYPNSTIDADVTTLYGAYLAGAFTAATKIGTRYGVVVANPANAATAITTHHGVYIQALQATGTVTAFRAQVAAAANKWNLFLDGSAQNYILGNVGIGSGKTAPAEALDVAGNGRFTGGSPYVNIEATANAILRLVGTSGNASLIDFNTFNVGVSENRWRVYRNFTPEIAGDTTREGSDFQVARYTNGATLLGTALLIQRSTGFMKLGSSALPTAQLDVAGRIAVTDSPNVTHVVLSNRFALIGSVNFSLTNNAVYNSVAGKFQYITTDVASKLSLNSSQVLTYGVAASGAAGADITWSEYTVWHSGNISPLTGSGTINVLPRWGPTTTSLTNSGVTDDNNTLQVDRRLFTRSPSINSNVALSSSQCEWYHNSISTDPNRWMKIASFNIAANYGTGGCKVVFEVHCGQYTSATRTSYYIEMGDRNSATNPMRYYMRAEGAIRDAASSGIQVYAEDTAFGAESKSYHIYIYSKTGSTGFTSTMVTAKNVGYNRSQVVFHPNPTIIETTPPGVLDFDCATFTPNWSCFGYATGAVGSTQVGGSSVLSTFRVNGTASAIGLIDTSLLDKAVIGTDTGGRLKESSLSALGIGPGTPNYHAKWLTATTLGTGILEDLSSAVNLNFIGAANIFRMVGVDEVVASAGTNVFVIRGKNAASTTDVWLGFHPTFGANTGGMLSQPDKWVGYFGGSAAGNLGWRVYKGYQDVTNLVWQGQGWVTGENAIHNQVIVQHNPTGTNYYRIATLPAFDNTSSHDGVKLRVRFAPWAGIAVTSPVGYDINELECFFKSRGGSSGVLRVARMWRKGSPDSNCKVLVYYDGDTPKTYGVYIALTSTYRDVFYDIDTTNGFYPLGGLIITPPTVTNTAPALTLVFDSNAVSSPTQKTDIFAGSLDVEGITCKGVRITTLLSKSILGTDADGDLEEHTLASLGVATGSGNWPYSTVWTGANTLGQGTLQDDGSVAMALATNTAPTSDSIFRLYKTFTAAVDTVGLAIRNHRTADSTNKSDWSILIDPILSQGGTHLGHADVLVNPTFSGACVTGTAYGMSSRLAISNGSIGTRYAFQVVGAALSGTGAITNEYGFYCSDLSGTTFRYAFHGNVSAGAGSRWNLFMLGNAPNYLAGNLGIGKTGPTVPLDVVGAGNITSTLFVGSTLTVGTIGGTAGGLILRPSATLPGYMEFYASSTQSATTGVRKGYIGASGGANYLALAGEDGYGWRVTGITFLVIPPLTCSALITGVGLRDTTLLNKPLLKTDAEGDLAETTITAAGGVGLPANGTVGTIPVFATANTIGDSKLKQAAGEVLRYTSAAAFSAMVMDGPGNVSSGYQWAQLGEPKFTLYLTGDAAADLELKKYSGGAIVTPSPLKISRSTGITDFGGTPTVVGRNVAQLYAAGNVVTAQTLPRFYASDGRMYDSGVIDDSAAIYTIRPLVIIPPVPTLPSLPTPNLLTLVADNTIEEWIRFQRRSDLRNRWQIGVSAGKDTTDGGGAANPGNFQFLYYNTLPTYSTSILFEIAPVTSTFQTNLTCAPYRFDAGTAYIMDVCEAEYFRLNNSRGSFGTDPLHTWAGISGGTNPMRLRMTGWGYNDILLLTNNASLNLVCPTLDPITFAANQGGFVIHKRGNLFTTTPTEAFEIYVEQATNQPTAPAGDVGKSFTIGFSASVKLNGTNTALTTGRMFGWTNTEDILMSRARTPETMLSANTDRGFFYINCVDTVTATAPTGTPIYRGAGACPVIFNKGDNSLYVYNSGWKKQASTGTGGPGTGTPNYITKWTSAGNALTDSILLSGSTAVACYGHFYISPYVAGVIDTDADLYFNCRDAKLGQIKFQRHKGDTAQAKARWILKMMDNATEPITGTLKAGSDMMLMRYRDDGSAVPADVPPELTGRPGTASRILTVFRDTGVVDFEYFPTVRGLPLGAAGSGSGPGSGTVNNIPKWGTTTSLAPSSLTDGQVAGELEALITGGSLQQTFRVKTTGTGASAEPVVAVNAHVARRSRIEWQANLGAAANVTRWAALTELNASGVITGTGRSGASWKLISYDDAGLNPYTAITVDRASSGTNEGLVTFGGGISVTKTSAFNGAITFVGQANFISPFTIASTSKITNLNADLLDGKDSSEFQPKDADLDAIAALPAAAPAPQDGYLRRLPGGGWALDVGTASIGGSKEVITFIDGRTGGEPYTALTNANQMRPLPAGSPNWYYYVTDDLPSRYRMVYFAHGGGDTANANNFKVGFQISTDPTFPDSAATVTVSHIQNNNALGRQKFDGVVGVPDGTGPYYVRAGYMNHHASASFTFSVSMWVVTLIR